MLTIVRPTDVLGVSLSVTNAPNGHARRSGLETRLHCAGSFGTAFAKPLWPFVIHVEKGQ